MTPTQRLHDLGQSLRLDLMDCIAAKSAATAPPGTAGGRP